MILQFYYNSKTLSNYKLGPTTWTIHYHMSFIIIQIRVLIRSTNSRELFLDETIKKMSFKWRHIFSSSCWWLIWYKLIYLNIHSFDEIIKKSSSNLISFNSFSWKFLISINEHDRRFLAVCSGVKWNNKLNFQLCRLRLTDQKVHPTTTICHAADSELRKNHPFPLSHRVSTSEDDEDRNWTPKVS